MSSKDSHSLAFIDCWYHPFKPPTESISILENSTNVTLSENATNPFAKTKGWKDSSTGTGGGIKN